MNIGESGVAFQHSSRLAVGQRLSLSLDLPETGDTVQTLGRVMWSEASGATGVRFRKMSRSSLLRLREWLFVNALAGCVNYEAMQARALAPQYRPSTVAKFSPGPSRRELEVLKADDYGSVLMELTAIRKKLRGAELEDSLKLLNENACGLTRASGAAIALWDGQEMTCRASAGSAPGVGARFHLGVGFSGECVRAAELLRCDDTETDPRVDRAICRLLGIRSVMAAPALSADGVVGLLEVFSPEPFAFDPKSKIYLQRLAQMTTEAIQYAAQALEDKRRSDAVLAGTTPSADSEPDQRFDDQAPPETPPGAVESDILPASPGWRILIAAAAVALLALAGWLIPTVMKRMSASTPARSQPTLMAHGHSPASRPVVGSSGSDFDQLRELAEKGDATAQFSLGAHYALGEDVAQDYTLACHWFALAADQGNVTAQATLGAYYWAGRGVPQDLDKAYFWSVLAQAGGDEASKYRVAALASSMSHRQVVAAQEEANDWLLQHRLASKNSSGSRP